MGVGIAAVFGDIDRAAAIRASVVTSVRGGSAGLLDRTISSFAAYSEEVNGRPIATIGSKTPNFEGTFWEVLLDTATHLILPTHRDHADLVRRVQPLLAGVHARGA